MFCEGSGRTRGSISNISLTALNMCTAKLPIHHNCNRCHHENLFILWIETDCWPETKMTRDHRITSPILKNSKDYHRGNLCTQCVFAVSSCFLLVFYIPTQIPGKRPTLVILWIGLGACPRFVTDTWESPGRGGLLRSLVTKYFVTRQWHSIRSEIDKLHCCCCKYIMQQSDN